MSRVVPSIEKAIRVLDLVAANKPTALSLKQIATELDLPRSSALAICLTLTRADMLFRGIDGCYRLGPHSIALASRYLFDTNPIENLEYALESVPDIQSETVVLSVLDGADVVYIACRIGTHPIAVSYRIGMRLPAYCAASGKALLSLLTEDELLERLAGVDMSETAATGGPRSLPELLDELRLTRERGYAIDDEQVARGMCCFGAAIGSEYGNSSAAVSVSCVKATLDAEHYLSYADAIVNLADRLSTITTRPLAATAV